MILYSTIDDTVGMFDFNSVNLLNVVEEIERERRLRGSSWLTASGLQHRTKWSTCRKWLPFQGFWCSIAVLAACTARPILCDNKSISARQAGFAFSRPLWAILSDGRIVDRDAPCPWLNGRPVHREQSSRLDNDQLHC
ncbi:hypothetical protein Tsp_07742 [Trichinella spiralis]|uniref:hypothetical protein n=1 Tax=Trichinella spiralis TaxID=6334 RepID=UPI0001EFC9FF|nr:hypothetical protein Tsp_07742 [Trichinella spiralis]